MKFWVWIVGELVDVDAWTCRSLFPFDFLAVAMSYLTLSTLSSYILFSENDSNRSIHRFVTVDASLVVPDSEEDENSSTHTGSSASNKNRPKEKVALALNGSDALYAEVRNQNVEKFGSFLQNQAKALKESHSNFTNKDKDLTEIHQFVKQIPVCW